MFSPKCCFPFPSAVLAPYPYRILSNAGHSHPLRHSLPVSARSGTTTQKKKEKEPEQSPRQPTFVQCPSCITTVTKILASFTSKVLLFSSIASILITNLPLRPPPS